MRSPKVETDFIEWCRYIHPDINPYLFFQRHARYSDEYFPLFEEKQLTARFGQEYIDYKKRVPRWLPELFRK